MSCYTGSIPAFGSDCDRVDLATGKLEYDDGVITEWGANGDFIFATYTNGRGTLGGTITDDWTITGGTGRFCGCDRARHRGVHSAGAAVVRRQADSVHQPVGGLDLVRRLEGGGRNSDLRG